VNFGKKISGLPMATADSYKFYYHRRLEAVVLVFDNAFVSYSIFICLANTTRFYQIRPNFQGTALGRCEGEYGVDIVCDYQNGRKGLMIDKTGRNQREIIIPSDTEINRALNNENNFRWKICKQLVFSDKVVLSVAHKKESSRSDQLYLHFLLYSVTNLIWAFGLTYLREIYSLCLHDIPIGGIKNSYSSKWADNHDFLLIISLKSDPKNMGFFRFLNARNFTEFTMTVLGKMSQAGIDIMNEKILVLLGLRLGRIIKRVCMVKPPCDDSGGLNITRQLHGAESNTLYVLLYINSNFDIFFEKEGRLVAWPNMKVKDKQIRTYTLS
jgi:hypothetical protein